MSEEIISEEKRSLDLRSTQNDSIMSESTMGEEFGKFGMLGPTKLLS